MLKGKIILFEYWFKSKLWQICQGFNLFSILNQWDKLFRELTGVKKSLELWLLLKEIKVFRCKVKVLPSNYIGTNGKI
jgi:hypothetical protein